MSYWAVIGEAPPITDDEVRWEVEYSGYPENPVIITFSFETEEEAELFYNKNNDLDIITPEECVDANDDYPTTH